MAKELTRTSPLRVFAISPESNHPTPTPTSTTSLTTASVVIALEVGL